MGGNMEKSFKIGSKTTPKKQVDVWVIPVNHLASEDRITVDVEEDDVHAMQDKWDEEDLAMQRGEQEYLNRE